MFLALRAVVLREREREKTCFKKGGSAFAEVIGSGERERVWRVFSPVSQEVVFLSSVFFFFLSCALDMNQSLPASNDSSQNLPPEGKLDFLVSQVVSLRKEVQDLGKVEQQVLKNKDEIYLLKEDSDRNREEIELMRAEIKRLGTEMDFVRGQAERNEAQERRFNLLVSGVAENGRESWDETAKVVQELFREKLGIPEPPFIQRAHRIGPFRSNLAFPRTIVVKFRDYPSREQVLRERRKLAGTPIFINEHFTEAVQDAPKKAVGLVQRSP